MSPSKTFLVPTTDLRSKANKLLVDWSVAKERVRTAKSSLQDAQQRSQTAQDAQKLVQSVAVKVQETAHAQIAMIVSRCLSAVFDEPYEFKILFEKKRGKTDAVLVFEKDGLRLDPKDEVGGGVLDVAAFALRLACLLLQRPVKRKLLVMDEPFKFLSERGQYRERIKELLLTLAEELNVQFLIVTHSSALEIGKVITLGEKT